MRIIPALLLLLLASAFETSDVDRAAAAMQPAHLLDVIRELSSDAYTGRLPGTEGENKSVAYLIAQCKALGLQPGAPGGGWTQPVPLWGTRSHGTLTMSTRGSALPWHAGTDYVAWSFLPDKQVVIRESPLYFAGYGVAAPEYGWDDYAGVDIRGKTVLLLSGDPQVADPHDPQQLDQKMFGGRALTWYGRTGTKLDEAYRRGASAVILLSAARQTGASLFANYSRENMILRGPDERRRPAAQALLTAEAGAALFSSAGMDAAAMRQAANQRGFHATVLPGITVTLSVENQVRQFDSQNVLAKLNGNDPRLRNEYVVYSGHWDHHGQQGAEIFHGASDNAAGTAGVLELARAMHQLQGQLRRTVLFLWPTAEEKGLLGAKYYVEHPLYPLAQTVADINLDYFSNWGWGRTRDFSIVGLGNSTLDDWTADAVARQGRVLTGDTAPEQGFYFRSDHYEFARLGVPSLETSPGIDYVGKPAGFGEQKRADYIRNDYHRGTDVVKPDWDLSGAVEDLRVLLEVGYRAAQSDQRPQWKPDAVWRPRS